jgi:hypothetical protein
MCTATEQAGFSAARICNDLRAGCYSVLHARQLVEPQVALRADLQRYVLTACVAPCHSQRAKAVPQQMLLHGGDRLAVHR